MSAGWHLYRIVTAVLLSASLGVAGCGRDDDRSAGVVIDTLANGAVRVINADMVEVETEVGPRITEELRIGRLEGTGPDVFTRIEDLAVDVRGRIYVLDRRAQEVRVFDAAGAHVRTFGRTGSGPGELRDPIAFEWGPDHELWIVDPGNGRYSVFDTAGAFLRTMRRDIGGYSLPWPGGFDREGRLYDSSIGPHPSGSGLRAVLVRMDAAGRPVDTLDAPYRPTPTFELRSGDGITFVAVPFAPYLVWRFDPRGYLWFAVNESYRIYQRRLAGDTIRIIEKAVENVPVTLEERRQRLENLSWFMERGGKLDESRIPATKPAFSQFFVDSAGRLWVWPTLPAGKDAGHRLDVFNSEGRYLGQARADFRVNAYPPPLFLDETVYAVTSDELDVQYIVRGRIAGVGG